MSEQDTHSRWAKANFKAWEMECRGRSTKARLGHLLNQMSKENVKAGYWYYRAMVKRGLHRDK